MKTVVHAGEGCTQREPPILSWVCANPPIPAQHLTLTIGFSTAGRPLLQHSQIAVRWCGLCMPGGFRVLAPALIAILAGSMQRAYVTFTTA